jgi:hypothetical protein
MALANKYNLEFFQGSTFFLNLSVKNANGSLKDLSDSSARMQIRQSYNSPTITESLSTSNGEITIDSATSALSITLSADRTANIAVNLNDSSVPPRTKYVYDLELQESSNVVTKLL